MTIPATPRLLRLGIFCLLLAAGVYALLLFYLRNMAAAPKNMLPSLLLASHPSTSPTSSSLPAACLAPGLEADNQILHNFFMSTDDGPDFGKSTEEPSDAELMFVTNSQKPFCYGLGNHLFRLASLYGLGRFTDRRPAFAKSSQCMEAEEFPGEFATIFPLWNRVVRFIDLPLNKTVFVPKFVAKDCCHYDEPFKANLLAINARNLVLSGAVYLQIFHYFNAWRDQIRLMFRFSAQLCRQALAQQRKLFGEAATSSSDATKRHLLCAHTQRGDFIAKGWQSERNSTEAAINFCLKTLLKQEGKDGLTNVSLALLGDDQQFMRELTIQNVPSEQIYMPEKRARGEDMAFAVLSCDSLLITAAASTYAWWIAYLMKASPVGRIFFIANFTNMDRNRNNFLPDWTPIQMDPSDLLHHMATALNPCYLIARGVPVYTIHQNAGELVITFPQAYHSGYNEGLNFAEAANFAPSDWLPIGRQCPPKLLLSHAELLLKMAFASRKLSIEMSFAVISELQWIVAEWYASIMMNKFVANAISNAIRNASHFIDFLHLANMIAWIAKRLDKFFDYDHTHSENFNESQPIDQADENNALSENDKMRAQFWLERVILFVHGIAVDC